MRTQDRRIYAEHASDRGGVRAEATWHREGNPPVPLCIAWLAV
jgi:hypothetical protein